MHSGNAHIVTHRTLLRKARFNGARTLEAEAEGSQIQGQPQQLSKTLSQNKKIKGVLRASWIQAPVPREMGTREEKGKGQ